MAATSQGRRLTEEHRQAQIAVQQGFLAEFLALWALLDHNRLDDTSPGWLRAVMRLLGVYRQRSADTAVDYYRRLRAVEAPEVTAAAPIPVFDRPALVEPVDRRVARGNRGRVVSQLGSESARSQIPLVRDRARQVAPRINWGEDDKAARTSLIVTGPVNIKSRTGRGEGVQIVNRRALVEASGAAARHVLNGGRKTLLTVVGADDVALGWQRVGDGNPCSFCAVLISRGPVYGSKRSASFRAHDLCACTAEPVFSRDADWAPGAREFRRLWDEVTQGASGKDALNAFRREYENRQGSARTSRAPRRERIDMGREVDLQRIRELEAEIAALEATFANLQRRKDRGEDVSRPYAYQRDRLAKLRAELAQLRRQAA